MLIRLLFYVYGLYSCFFSSQDACLSNFLVNGATMESTRALRRESSEAPGATLKQLRSEDKQKVAKLINQVRCYVFCSAVLSMQETLFPVRLAS